MSHSSMEFLFWQLPQNIFLFLIEFSINLIKILSLSMYIIIYFN